jgi:hypothetical protein
MNADLAKEFFKKYYKSKTTQVLASFRMNQPKTRGLDPSGPLHGLEYKPRAMLARCNHQFGARALELPTRIIPLG